MKRNFQWVVPSEIIKNTELTRRLVLLEQLSINEIVFCAIGLFFKLIPARDTLSAQYCDQLYDRWSPELFSPASCRWSS